MSAAKTPVLSLILCSRNDAYMGNSLWRLETTLNYTADRVRTLGLEHDIEVVVADWGSELPLAEVLALEPAAAEIVSFVRVPPALARERQRDSPFPEVIALNAAARRARGRYIGRIDQDTLVGGRFLRWMTDAARAGRPLEGIGAPLERTLLFANRRNIPYRLAVLCPRLPIVERFVAWFGPRLLVEGGVIVYNNSVGIWLAHRDLWDECGGYDERMIYMNDMEIDMVARLMSRYPLVDLGRLVGYDFYHLDHYHPRGSRSSSSHRRVNSDRRLPPAGFKPSGDAWGLAADSIELARQAPAERQRPAPSMAVFLCLALYTGLHTGVDRLIYPFYPVWKRRASIAWATVRGEPVVRWPSLLRKLWLDRPSARRVVHP